MEKMNECTRFVDRRCGKFLSLDQVLTSITCAQGDEVVKS